MNSERPQNNIIDKEEFLNKLNLARESEDTYVVARLLGVLMGAGADVSPTEAEKTAMLAELQKVRNGEVNDFFKNVEGYMVARWIMLVNHFIPGGAEVTENDRAMIEAALSYYIQHEEYHQVASLIQTCEMIGLELDLSELSDDAKIQVGEFRKTME